MIWEEASLFMNVLNSMDKGKCETSRCRGHDHRRSARAAGAAASACTADIAGPTAAQARLHRLALREALRLERARWADDSSISSVQVMAKLLKTEPLDQYSVRPLSKAGKERMRADDIDEPSSDLTVDMLAALPPEEAEFYANEENVVDAADKSRVLFEELESKFGFVGGSYEQYTV